MKRIGIITFAFSENIGGNLQAYATKEVIKNMGFETEIIDYRIMDGRLENRLSIKKKLLSGIKNSVIYRERRFLYKNNFIRKNNKFNDFREQYLSLSECTYYYEKDLVNNPPQYDIYLCGSDQIWNPVYYNRTNAFFLSFVPDGRRKLSYASSVGISYIPQESEERMKKYISEIDYISCREKTGAKLISDLTGKNVEVVLDPTLLIKADVWFNKFKSDRIVEEKYILCYCMFNGKKCRNFIKEMKKKYGYKIVSIFPMEGDIINCYTRIYDIGPLEFLNLIKYAEFVITDSYHGMLFSVNFNKEFFVALKECKKNNSDNSRKIDFLNDLNLKNRIITDEVDLSSISKINYEIPNKILEEKRSHSFDYLKKALEE